MENICEKQCINGPYWPKQINKLSTFKYCPCLLFLSYCICVFVLLSLPCWFSFAVSSFAVCRPFHNLPSALSFISDLCCVCRAVSLIMSPLCSSCRSSKRSPIPSLPSLVLSYVYDNVLLSLSSTSFLSLSSCSL